VRDPSKIEAGPLAPQAETPARDVEPDLDLAVMLRLPGVNGSRESPVLRRLLCLFVSETARNIKGLHCGAEAGDRPAVQALAHKMKSASMAIGASRLAARARSLEACMKGGARPRPADVKAVAVAWHDCGKALVSEGLLSVDGWSGVEGPMER